MRMFPVLRGEVASLAPAESKAALPIAFAQYYADLATYNVHRRAANWPIERAVTEGFERVIWVFKAVNTIASDSARLPFRLKDGDQIVDDHPLYRVLNKKANPLESGQVFRKRLSAQVLLSKKGAFVEITKSNGGTIKRLDLLPPDRTEIVPGTGADLIDHFRLTRRDGSYKPIDPERVRWFRDPHPLDPYSGVTPLEAMGMSVELDHFARLYNVSFLQNDGRPGGVLAVRKTDGQGGDIDETQMNRIEDRFGKGPIEAGKLSVIAGDLSYVDLAARPRDMQYGALSRNSKIEILSGFGVAESVLGYAAERTFDNAEQELYNYWTRTMPAHNEILLTGFDEDSEDDLTGYLDTSGIEVLERAERQRRDEARTEVEKGLRSPWSYMQLAGYADEFDENPYLRAIYMPQGKTPVPGKEEDAEALGLAAPAEEAAPAVAAPAAAPALPAGAPAVDDGIDREALAAAGASAADIESTRDPVTDRVPTGAAAAALTTAGKSARPALHAIEGGQAPKARASYRLSASGKGFSDVVESAPDPATADALEDALSAALAALAERWIGRTVARIESPKSRKGTRHWTPEFETDTRVGTKALDAPRAVDEQAWQEDAEAAAHPLIEMAAVSAAIALLTDLRFTPPAGRTLDAIAREVVAPTVRSLVSFVGRSALKQAALLTRRINEADQQGEPLDSIIDTVRDYARRIRTGWAAGVAVQTATATINGAREVAAEHIEVQEPDREIDREWVTRRDDKVRETHHEADGQRQGLDDPFVVGESLLRYPGDELAPIHETANCRCRLRHRSRRTGRFVAAPEMTG
jgi:HK97 family phage portal protein